MRGGGSRIEATRLFHVGRTTLYRWLNAPDLPPRRAKERRRKLDKAALAAHVRAFPDVLLRAAGGAFWGWRQRDLGGLEEIEDHKKNDEIF